MGRIKDMLDDDWYYRHAWDEYYTEMRLDVIESFKGEQSRRYFLDHPGLASVAFDALDRARALVGAEATAGFVFAAIAQEVALKQAILRPLTFGLVHNEAVAQLVTDFAIGTGSALRFRDLVVGLLTEFGGVDLAQDRRPESSDSLWAEIAATTRLRNRVVHEGAEVTPEDAERASAVAAELLEGVLPRVLDHLELRLDGRVVRERPPQPPPAEDDLPF